MSEEINEVRAFAFIVDGEVVGTFHISNVSPNHERLWAGLASDPTVIECTDTPEVSYGWIHDGKSFIQPGV